ncbi:hypothetical protein [Mesorhizobium jarvisii]|uniref:hypothetical protein n=1 Tax=Mesorhizobium jarvisii TaxID=1777867 RepID=UPI0012DB2E65|nr:MULTISPECIES: hypothetical protein [Mesorhizobium]
MMPSPPVVVYLAIDPLIRQGVGAAITMAIPSSIRYVNHFTDMIAGACLSLFWKRGGLITGQVLALPNDDNAAEASERAEHIHHIRRTSAEGYLPRSVHVDTAEEIGPRLTPPSTPINAKGSSQE